MKIITWVNFHSNREDSRVWLCFEEIQSTDNGEVWDVVDWSVVEWITVHKVEADRYNAGVRGPTQPSITRDVDLCGHVHLNHK